MALPTEADYQALRQIQIERNGGVDPNATPSEIEKQINAIDAKRGKTAESSAQNNDAASGQEELSDSEKSQLGNSSESGDEAGTGNNEDPFEKARQDSEDAYNEPGPTEANVPVEATANEPAKSGSEKVEANRSVPKYAPRTNPLHKYATYTYGLTLYILTDQDINELATNPQSWEPNWGSVRTCLISSGGKNTSAYARNDNFKDDFYFDNLKMTTVIGMNAKSKASNAIDISFTIIEPYGMSLLDRIIAVADDLKGPNFKSMPYLLEIDFYGQTDSGVQEISSQKKRIPIQIIEFKIKAGTKGSEYAIKAIPWSHQALTQTAATTPINLEVSAETIKDFFANSPTDELAIIEQSTKKTNAQSSSQRINATPGGDNTSKGRTPDQQKQLADNEKIMSESYAATSFCAGVNGWYKDLVIKKLRGTQDSISFKIHEDIIDSKIVRPQNKDITRSSAVTKKDEQETAQTVKKSADNGASAFNNKGAFSVSAGTSIIHVIDMVMRNSDYIKNQITDPKDTRPSDLAERLGKPLKWYKIIPSVTVGKFDYATGKYSKNTTYSIVPYIVYDSKHPNGPVTAPMGSMKKYSYSYTGKNTDILDFSIDFDTLFYTAVTAGSAKWQANKLQQAEQQKDDASKVAIESMQSTAALVNRQLHLVPNQPQQQGMGGQQQDAQTVLAADMQKNLYSTMRGDMLNLKLKIVGDPELIKQDDIYTNPVQNGYAEQASSDLLATGSIPMDNGEVICQVDFKTILDMDQATGLPKSMVEPDKSTFTGQYKILTVDNTFSNGKFEQVLDMVRLPEIANANTIHKNSPDPANSSFPNNANTAGTANGSRTPTDGENAEPNNNATPTEPESDNGNESAKETNFDEFGNVVEPPQQLGDDAGYNYDSEPDNYEELNSIAENGDTVTTEQIDNVDWDNPGPTIQTNQVDAEF